MGNAQIERIEKDFTNIKDFLKGIKNNPTKRAHEIVELLEDYNFLEENFQLSQIDTRQYTSIEQRYEAFCRVYLMKLFLEFIPNEHDSEILLMCYDYLQNFAGTTLMERYQKYWDYSHTYNERIMGKNRKDKGNLLREAENNILSELSEALVRIISNSNGKLGFAEEVLSDFTNGDIPKKLTLPITDYFNKNQKVVGKSISPTKETNIGVEDGDDTIQEGSDVTPEPDFNEIPLSVELEDEKNPLGEPNKEGKTAGLDSGGEADGGNFSKDPKAIPEPNPLDNPLSDERKNTNNSNNPNLEPPRKKNNDEGKKKKDRGKSGWKKKCVAGLVAICLVVILWITFMPAISNFVHAISCNFTMQFEQEQYSTNTSSDGKASISGGKTQSDDQGDLQKSIGHKYSFEANLNFTFESSSPIIPSESESTEEVPGW